jgi:transcriptional regulator GlxA family with amidase domain
MDLARVGILLRAGFSLRTLAGVVDTLLAANALQDEWVYEPVLLGEGEVVADGGVKLSTQASPAGARWAALLLLAPDLGQTLDPSWCTLAGQGVAIGGLDAGASALAAAGLLQGQRACADWQVLDTLAQQHPRVAWSQGLWEVSSDGLRLSCGGGGASLDMMAAWLAQRHGERLLGELAPALGLRGFRARDERQRAADPAMGSPKLAEALALMEANLGEPLPTEEVARLVGVSRRQLERLFKQHLDALPSRHYLELRLARAQRLLQQSSQSILQVGLSCGFSSGPHFSNAYKAHFGHTPRDERATRLRGDAT